MTKDEFIIQAVLSLNKGQSGSYYKRVEMAIEQFNQLEENKVCFDGLYRFRPHKNEEDK